VQAWVHTADEPCLMAPHMHERGLALHKGAVHTLGETAKLKPRGKAARYWLRSSCSRLQWLSEGASVLSGATPLQRPHYAFTALSGLGELSLATRALSILDTERSAYLMHAQQ
jgi:hypothetical protein